MWSYLELFVQLCAWSKHTTMAVKRQGWEKGHEKHICFFWILYPDSGFPPIIAVPTIQQVNHHPVFNTMLFVDRIFLFPWRCNIICPRHLLILVILLQHAYVILAWKFIQVYLERWWAVRIINFDSGWPWKPTGCLVIDILIFTELVVVIHHSTWEDGRWQGKNKRHEQAEQYAKDGPLPSSRHDLVHHHLCFSRYLPRNPTIGHLSRQSLSSVSKTITLEKKVV